jgi:hypothetical protein
MWPAMCPEKSWCDRRGVRTWVCCTAGRGACLSQRDRLHPSPNSTLLGSCLRRDRSQRRSVWSECLGCIPRHVLGRTTVFWSARGRAQRRRRFGPARIGKLTPIRIPCSSTASHEEPRNPQQGHLRPDAHRDGSRHHPRHLPPPPTAGRAKRPAEPQPARNQTTEPLTGTVRATQKRQRTTAVQDASPWWGACTQLRSSSTKNSVMHPGTDIPFPSGRQGRRPSV